MDAFEFIYSIKINCPCERIYIGLQSISLFTQTEFNNCSRFSELLMRDGSGYVNAYDGIFQNSR